MLYHAGPRVVSKMVFAAHFSTPSQTELIGKMTENEIPTSQTELIGKMTENANKKIPIYAIEYKREYLFIRGLNKEFMYLINKLDNLNDGLFESNTVNRIKYNMKRFLRGQEKGKLKDISDLFLPYNLFSNFIFINEQFEFYKQRYDAFCDDDIYYESDYVSDDDSDDGDGEYLVDGKPYPGFIEFYDIFKKIFSQIKNEDSYSDDEDIDDYNIILPDTDVDTDDEYDSDNF